MLISCSSDNTLTFTDWCTPIQSTVHQNGMLLHPVHPKYTQHHKSTLLHLPKRCLYTSLYTATTEDIRPTIGKLLQGRRCLKIAQMLQDHHMRPHFFPLQYSCVLCQKWFGADKTQGGSSYYHLSGLLDRSYPMHSSIQCTVGMIGLPQTRGALIQKTHTNSTKYMYSITIASQYSFQQVVERRVEREMVYCSKVAISYLTIAQPHSSSQLDESYKSQLAKRSAQPTEYTYSDSQLH